MVAFSSGTIGPLCCYDHAISGAEFLRFRDGRMHADFIDLQTMVVRVDNDDSVETGSPEPGSQGARIAIGSASMTAVAGLKSVESREHVFRAARYYRASQPW